jgi:hypothetical protein
MNISVFLFFLIFSIILIIISISKKPEKNDNCYDNQIIYYNTLKYLLWVYVCILIIIIFTKSLDIKLCNNILLLLYGFITVGFIIILGLSIGIKKLECILNDVKIYLSIIPLFVFGIIAIILGYLGNILVGR